jgi:hypothetical protein
LDEGPIGALDGVGYIQCAMKATACGDGGPVEKAGKNIDEAVRDLEK